jgi:hypothetical protein
MDTRPIAIISTNIVKGLMMLKMMLEGESEVQDNIFFNGLEYFLFSVDETSANYMQGAEYIAYLKEKTEFLEGEVYILRHFISTPAIPEMMQANLWAYARWHQEYMVKYINETPDKRLDEVTEKPIRATLALPQALKMWGEPK